MPKPRRIWATVKQDVYTRFRERARSKGLNVPDVMRSLVEQWADGGIELKRRPKGNWREHGSNSIDR